MYAIARTAAFSLGRRNASAPLRRGLREGISNGAAPSRVRVTTLDIARGIRRQSTNSSSSTVGATSATASAETPKRPIYIRLPFAVALTLLSFTLGFTVMAADAIPALVEASRPPTDEETMSLYTPTTEELQAIENTIMAHPLTRSLLQDEKFTASRPHLKIPEAMRHQSLTGGTLLGGDKIAVPPLQFQTPDGAEFVSIQYLGQGLCGHPGIVHGGLLATLLDEGLGRCCFPALPNKVAVTASLTVQYKKPVMAGQVVVLRAVTDRVEGRKAWVRGWMETLPEDDKTEAVRLVEAEALFIEPRQAATMKRVAT